MLTQECLQDAVKYGECFIKFGKTAEYIPELARVNKYHLGACIVGLDGTVMEYGCILSGSSPNHFPRNGSV
mgnify:CR=1 FL=1